MSKKEEKTPEAFKKDWGKTYEDLVNDQLTKNSEFFMKNQTEKGIPKELKDKEQQKDVVKQLPRIEEPKDKQPAVDGEKTYYTGWERIGAVDYLTNIAKMGKIASGEDLGSVKEEKPAKKGKK
jgi:hypothetical protein